MENRFYLLVYWRFSNAFEICKRTFHRKQQSKCLQQSAESLCIKRTQFSFCTKSCVQLPYPCETAEIHTSVWLTRKALSVHLLIFAIKENPCNIQGRVVNWSVIVKYLFSISAFSVLQCYTNLQLTKKKTNQNKTKKNTNKPQFAAFIISYGRYIAKDLLGSHQNRNDESTSSAAYMNVIFKFNHLDMMLSYRLQPGLCHGITRCRTLMAVL